MLRVGGVGVRLVGLYVPEVQHHSQDDTAHYEGGDEDAEDQTPSVSPVFEDGVLQECGVFGLPRPHWFAVHRPQFGWTRGSLLQGQNNYICHSNKLK